MKNTRLNLKYSRRRTRTSFVDNKLSNRFGSDLKFLFWDKFDTALSFNEKTSVDTDLRTLKITQQTLHRDAAAQTIFSLLIWRLTPKVDWSLDKTFKGKVLSEQVRVITPSLQARADINLPAGLKVPFRAKPLTFTNRIIWTTNASFAIKRSKLKKKDNTNLLDISTNADYEIARNLRMTLNGSLQRFWHRFEKEEDFISYAIGTTLTFQF